MSRLEAYTTEFYQWLSVRSEQSAKVIVPLFLRYFEIASVVDIGCGIGTWLKVFSENNVSEIKGVDGPHIDTTMLMINNNAFATANLAEPFVVDRRYDLAVSLEVAEHLPEERAASFVKDLTDLASVVLFSAAVPGQPGVEHINAQWQDYWRTIFHEHGYVPLDIVRPAIWGRPDVDYWYQQNTMVYCHETIITDRPDLHCVSQNVSLNVVHPDLYELKAQEYQETIRTLSQPNLRRAIHEISRLALKPIGMRLRSLFEHIPGKKGASKQ
jgi:SAM-dependent methyltransferase